MSHISEGDSTLQPDALIQDLDGRQVHCSVLGSLVSVLKTRPDLLNKSCTPTHDINYDKV